MFGTNMGSGFGSALVDFLGLYRPQASCVFQHLRIGSLEPPAKITTVADVHRDQRPLPTCCIEAPASPEKADDGTFGCPLQSQITSTVRGGRFSAPTRHFDESASAGDLLPDFGCLHRKMQDLCILVSSNGLNRRQIGQYVPWTAQFFVICM
jgi:hypothetical protein